MDFILIVFGASLLLFVQVLIIVHIFYRISKYYSIVGYGDYYPTTTIGRFTIFILGIWGIFCVSLVVVTFSNVLEMENSENRAYNLMKRLDARHKAKSYAKKVIQSIFLLKKKKETFNYDFKFHLITLKKNLKKFSKISNRISNTYDPSSLYEMMITNFSIMKSEIKIIKANQDSLMKQIGVETIKLDIPSKNQIEDSSVIREDSLSFSQKSISSNKHKDEEKIIEGIFFLQ